jgi:hypothetical protein
MHSEDRRYLVRNLMLAAAAICGFGMLALPALAFVLNVFVDFDGPVERIALSGPEAQSQLGKQWPDGLDSGLVDAVDFKWHGSRDSGSTWFKIRCTPAAARTWTKKMRDDELGWAAFCRRLHSDREGIDRVLHGKPDLRQATGTPPAWWAPPSIDFQAAEIMLWYKTNPSGVARCIYSGFDSSTQTLWIYHYLCQHDRMWTRGSPPNGTGIDFTKVAPRGL